jgi:hypothetical protein
VKIINFFFLKKDVNECQNSNTCDHRFKCKNIDGSYNCECNYGYKLDNNSICKYDSKL